MVAFVTSMLIGLLMFAGVLWYGSTRRKPGERLTWGQAYLAAVYATVAMFFWYGIVPHSWLQWADNELNWNSGALILGPGSTTLVDVVPFTVSKLHIRDLIAVHLYVVPFSVQVWLWAWWNKREQAAATKAKQIPTSTYGRPLVKKG